MHDVMIIGSGPAGLSAAVYAARAQLDVLLLESQPMGGGQILNTYEVDNYLGLPGISGFELSQKFMEHIKKFGIEPVTEEALRVECQGAVKKAVTAKQEYEARTLIYAAGSVHRPLGVPGETEFAGKGVSYCAACDGAFFKDKTVAVVGGGDVALEDALLLARICKKVYLIHRRDAFRGAKLLAHRVKETGNIELVLEAKVEEILGDGVVSGVRVFHKKKGETETLAVDGVFAAVGTLPRTELLSGQVEMDGDGYIIAGESCRTSADGVYAAGDVRAKAFRQVITAACDGANAVMDIERRLLG